MNRYYIVIPFWKKLTKEENWKNTKKKFFCARYHFELRYRQLSETSKIGEKIAVDGSPLGTVIEKTTKITKEREVIDINESIQEAIIQDETLVEITGILSKKIKLLGNESSAEIKGKIHHKINNSFKNQFKISNTIRINKTIEFEVKSIIESEEIEPVATVAVYQKQAIDIFLCLVDYLEIDYRRSFWGIRKKRKKNPPSPINQHEHRNYILYNKPIATVEYWKLLTKSCRMLPECKHIIEVEDPGEIKVSLPKTTKCSYLGKPETPTLYQISNAAFPTKWIKRKTEFTEEELIKMEEEEIKKLRSTRAHK